MDNPKLSIVVAFHNVEKYLSTCLTSVVNGGIEGAEVIAVNDGSTDRSLQIATEFQQQYPGKIRVVSKEQGGMSDARNFGLKEATGEYIMFFDSDDIIMPGVIGEMISAADEADADIVVADYYEFNDNDEENKKYRYDKAAFKGPLITEESRLLPLFRVEVSYAIWNKLYKKSFLVNNNLGFLKGYWFEDLDFVFRAFYKARKVIKVDKVLYGYRQRPGSIMKSISKKMLDKMDVMHQLRHFLQQEGKFEKYKEWYNVLYLKMAFSILYSSFKYMKDRKLSMEIMREVLKDPYFKKITKQPLKEKASLGKTEVTLFTLIKYKIVNFQTLYASSFLFLK